MIHRTASLGSARTLAFRGSDLEAVFAVVVPVHNQEEIIEGNLMSLMKSLSMPFEIVCVDDASTDASSEAIIRALSKASNSISNFSHGLLISANEPLFETLADTVGVSATKAPIILEVQADMRVFDTGFDRRLKTTFDNHEDIFMISGRGVEPLLPIAQHFMRSGGAVNSRGRTPELHLLNSVPGVSTLIKMVSIFTAAPAGRPNQLDEGTFIDVTPTREQFELSGGRAGRLGEKVEKELEASTQEKNQIWLGETVMRGPLAIRRSAFDEVGGFDTNAFFLGFDDHDLALRGWMSRRYRSGFLPIEFDSPLNVGTTRRRPTWRKIFEIYVKLSRVRNARRLSALFNLLESEIKLPEMEIRNINEKGPEIGF